MSLADEILGGSSSKQTNKSNNKNNNKNNSNKKKNNQTKISDEIFSGNYSAPKQTTTVQQKQSTPKQTVKLTGNKFLDNAIKNANNTERNEATKQQIQALANRWNSNLDKKTLLQQVGNYVTSGDALDDATNLAKKGAMFATNKNYRNQVIKKGLNSAAVAIPQLAKGVIKTGENWYDTLQTADFLVNEGAARKLGITSEEDYQKKKQKLENKVKDDWTGNLWKYGFGWDEDVDKFLGQNSYITGSNTAGQLVESVGQQLPAMAIGQKGMDYMLGGNAANSAFQSLKGLRGAERVKAVGTNLTRAAAINSASNAEIFARSYGAATEEALQQGASLEQASKYGVLSALTEMGTEWVTSGIPGVEESTGLLSNGASKLLDKTTGKIKKEPLRRIVRNILDFTGGMAGEGFEEALSEVISPYIKNATYTQGEKVNLNDVVSSFLMGAASAGLLDFGGNITNRLTGRNSNIQNNELAQQQVQQIQEQVQNGEITPQEGTQQINDIQNYLRAQESTQTEPTTNETTQDNINAQEQQNATQNANNEANQKAEETFKNIKTKEDMDKLISNLKNKVENIKTGEDLKNTFKEIYDIYKVYNKSNDIYEVVEKDGLYGTKFESEFYNPDIKYKPLNEEIKIQKENLDSWLSHMQNDVDKIVYDNQDKVTPTIGKNIKSLDEVTPITTDDFQSKIKDYINKETEDIKGKFESKDGHLYRGGKEIKYLYRAINQAEMDSIKNSGYIKSNQSKNIGYEIEQGLTDFKDGYPGFYLPRNADGYIIKIEVKPENGFFYDSDEYAKTPNQIPASQIVEINGERINNLQQNQVGVKNNNIENTQQQEYNKVTKEEGAENEFRKLQEESRRMSSKDTESFHSGQRQIDEGIRNRLSRVLGGRLQAGDGSLWNGNSSIVNEKTGKNIEILENVDPQTFKETFEIVQKYLPNGDAVDVHDVKSSEYSTGYEDTKNFLSKDGLSGFAITKDGDLISVFNLGEKGYLKSIKDYVKKNGAKTLDCYQSERQPLADMYNKTLGFKTASLMDFNYDILVEDKGKEYADYFVKTYGEAPVAFMVDTDQDIETKHFNKDQYDEALEYRNSLVDKEGTSDSSFSNEKNNIAETKTEPVAKVDLTGEKGKEYFMENGADEKVAQILSEKPKEAKTKLREKFKNIKDEAYRLFVSNRAELERIGKVTNRPDIVFKHDKAQRYQAEANHHIAEEQTDLNYKPYNNFTNENGKKVTMSLDAIRKDAKKHNISEQTLNEYLAHNLNVDRYVEGKPVFGESVTSDDSLKRIAEIEKENPEIKRIAQNVWTYEHNELKNTYDSGRISKELYDKLTQNEHYVRIQRNVEKKGSNAAVLGKDGKISVNQGIQEAKGGNQDILPILETIAQRTVENTKANRINESIKELASAMSMGSEDSTISSIDDEESFGVNPDLFKQNDDGTYTMTFFDKGKATVVPINKAIYDAYVTNKYISALENNKLFKAVTYLPKKVSSMFRTLTTNDNPMFMATNAFKDIGDAPFNSKYMKEFTKAYTSTEALREVAGNGGYNKLYNRAGGNSDSYLIDGEFKDKTQSKIGKAKDKLLTPIEKGNEVVESTPRMAEFIATIKANGYEVNSDGEMILKDSKKANGRSAESVLDEALYNAAEITTNFKRGGDLSKAINRNGGTFFNASIQGFDKQVRNFKDAFTSGDKKKIIALLAKALIFGVAPTMLNDAMNDDDEEYKNMQDYLKDNYYLFKTGDGNYVRIPKGRAMSVIGSAYRRTKDYASGEKDAFKGFTKFASGQVAPNNPFENNIIAPFFAVKNNKSWSGSKIVSQSMEKRPAAEQYNEKTDKFSKWLGGKINVSPMKINYLIDQYTGGIGDVALPMITPKATSKSSNPLVQPFVSKFTTDSVYQQKSVGNFYDAMDKAETKKYSIKATKEDKVKYSYLYSQNQKMAELYKEQRAIQADENISKKEKYEQARKIQKEINKLADESVKNSNNIKDHKYYATIGDNTYYLTTDNDGNDVWARDSYADTHKKSADKKGMALYDYYKEKYENRKNKKK